MMYKDYYKYILMQIFLEHNVYLAERKICKKYNKYFLLQLNSMANVRNIVCGSKYFISLSTKYV